MPLLIYSVAEDVEVAKGDVDLVTCTLDSVVNDSKGKFASSGWTQSVTELAYCCGGRGLYLLLPVIYLYASVASVYEQSLR